MLREGSGELSGTSIARNPASIRTWPITTASPGSTPRAMALPPKYRSPPSGFLLSCVQPQMKGGNPPNRTGQPP